MAFSAGSVTAKLTAKINDFQKGMKKAGKSLDQFGSKGKRLEDRLKDLERRKQDVITRMKEMEKAGKTNLSSYRNLSTRLAKYNDTIDTHKIKMDEFVRKQQKGVSALGRLGGAFNSLKQRGLKALGSINSFVRDVFVVAIGNILANAIGTATNAMKNFIGIGIQTAADLETTRSALEGLLGGAEEADKTLARIKKEAVATPFEMVGLTEGVKQLASVTDSGDEAIDILMNVGRAVTASGGGQAELDRVVFNLKQIQGIGKLEMVDLKELRRAIPMFDQIVEASGMTIDEIRNSKDPAGALFEAFEKGGEAIPAVAEAFSRQGGNFNQLMSNAKDSIMIASAEILTQSGAFDLLKQGVAGFTSLIDNNKEAIISFVQDGIEKLVNFWNNLLVPGFIYFKDNILPGLISIWVNNLVPAFNYLKDEVLPMLLDLWNNTLLPAFQSLWNIIVTLLWPALQDLWNTLMELYNTIQPFILPILRVLAIILGAIVVGAILLAIGVIYAIIKVMTWFYQGVIFLINGLKWLWNTISTGVSGALSWIAKKIGDLIIWFKKAKGKVDEFWQGLQKVWDNIKNIDLMQIGKDIIQGLIDGMGAKIQGIKDKANEIAGAITGSVKDFLGIQSPSKVFKEIGKFAGQGLEIGLKGEMGNVAMAGQDLAMSASSGTTANITNNNSFNIQGAGNDQAIISKVIRTLARQNNLASSGVNI